MRPLILGIVLLQFCRCEDEDCKKVKNVESIDKCPTTKQEWDEAAMKKNCAKLVLESQKNCSESLTYHCLINSFRNQTMEMCALKRIIDGGCPEFNDGGRVIQKHKDSPCNMKEFPSCVRVYNSTEAYQYQGCYNLVKKTTELVNKTTESVNKTTTDLVNKTTFEKSNERQTNLLLIIFGSLVAAICIGTIVIVLAVKRKIKICNRGEHSKRFLDLNVTKGENIELIPTQEKTNPEPKIIVRDYSDTRTATDKCVFAVLQSPDDLSEENKDESKRILKSYKTMDDYFVETATYKEGENTFSKYGIVIWTGHSGCGKTMAAIHLIRKQMAIANETCTFRKIRFWQELNYIEWDEKTLIFIDNIFFRRTIDLDLENWWNELQKIHDRFFQNTDTTDRLRFVITAQANVIERVCSFMTKTTPILNLNHTIEIKILSGEEKEDILKRQIEFAKNERNAQVPNMNEEFLSKVKSSEGPIGFPLCAHLYVCKKEYQKSGVAFFSRPIEYLKFQIKDEIESDKTNRTKSLFFVLYFHEWHTKSGNSEILNIRSKLKCSTFLKKISKNLLKKFKPFDFRDLGREAEKLVGTFLKEDSAHVYTFIHDSVYEAVGSLWCETYIVETARYFPLEIIQNQEYKDITRKQNTVLAARLLDELRNEKLSMVFACRPFKRRDFVDLFLTELTKKDRKAIIKFLTVAKDSAQVKLPPMFWASCNKLTYLTEKMYARVTEIKIQPDYQLYALLFGDCCARKESLLKPLNGVLKDNLEGIKQEVLQFKDDEENSIIHLVISSEKSDDFASVIVEKLLDEKRGFVDERNKEKVTPLMLAVDQLTKREKVIQKLMKKSPKLFHKDSGRSNVFHHCLSSCIDDENCAQYLKIILTGNDSEKYLMKDDANGNSVLCKAAMETKHSRICSILKLLEYVKTHITTLSDEGYSPLHLSVTSLQADSAYVELECCVRVILLLLCGDSPDNISDKNLRAVEQCKYSVVKNILKHPKDKRAMVTALDSILNKISECRDVCSSTVFPPFPKEIDLELQNRIKKSIQILKNKPF